VLMHAPILASVSVGGKRPVVVHFEADRTGVVFPEESQSIGQEVNHRLRRLCRFGQKYG
jgi:hypothetical protein